MQDPPRQEEQRGGPGGPEDQGSASEEVRPGEASARPGLIVWVVTHEDVLDPFGEVLGVAGSLERARELVEQHWDRPDRPVYWDENGPYYFRVLESGAKIRRPLDYQFERFTVL